MPLTANQRRYLRRLAHELHPIVMLGSGGVSDAVIGELDRALDDHELVKVRVRVGDRDTRATMIEQLCRRSESELVQRIGNVAVLYRVNREKPKLVIPDE